MTLARTQRASTPRAARRAPADLTFTPRRGHRRSLRRRRARLAGGRSARALALFDSLPSEGNQLYTPYIDLRGAELADVRLYEEPAGAPDAGAASELPDGIVALADLREDRVEALVVDDAARAAGVRVETLGGLLASDPMRLGDFSATPRRCRPPTASPS